MDNISLLRLLIPSIPVEYRHMLIILIHIEEVKKTLNSCRFFLSQSYPAPSECSKDDLLKNICCMAGLPDISSLSGLSSLLNPNTSDNNCNDDEIEDFFKDYLNNL